MSIWLPIFISGLLTYSMRLSFIVFYSRINMPDMMQRALRFVPPAVFTAIFLPELVLSEGALDLTLGNGRLLAGMVAILVAWRTKNVILTIVVGMLTLWILQALIS